MEDPDWFFDPVTGRDAPPAGLLLYDQPPGGGRYGNVKQIWELSRLHHVTVLTGSFSSYGDERSRIVQFCTCARGGGRSFPLRRALDERDRDWPTAHRMGLGTATALGMGKGSAALRMQRGSAGPNLVAPTVSGKLPESGIVGQQSRDRRSRRPPGVSARHSTGSQKVVVGVTKPHDSLRRSYGETRSQAVSIARWPSTTTASSRIGVVAAVEAELAQRPLSDELWALLARMFDVIAATVDVKLRAPRYGDGDDGRALVVDAPTAERWPGLLAIGEALFETPEWWPVVEPTVASSLLASMAARHPAVHPERRPNHYEDAGLTFLRSQPADADEIWCRCDAGPHGYLSIAAHGHADTLAVEVRHNGTDVLADPGTYCYHGEPEWRSYFRSTLAHNTVEVAGRAQSTAGGPFLWTRHARSTMLGLETDANGEVTAWSAAHDGYLDLDPPLRHRRSVRLQRQLRRIEIVDDLETAGGHPFRISFLLGPAIDARMTTHEVALTWLEGESEKCATLSLPGNLVDVGPWRNPSTSRMVLLAFRGDTADVGPRRRGGLQSDRHRHNDDRAAVRSINHPGTCSIEGGHTGHHVMAVDTGTSRSPLSRTVPSSPRTAPGPRLRLR